MTLAVSTWSLHRSLGSFYRDSPDEPRDGVAEPRWGPERLSLLDLPAELGRRGYAALQICHFHLPSRDPGYLAELRGSLDDSSVELDALLIDDGDLTHPTDADRHEAWVSGWVETAQALGAVKARVVAGRQVPTPERLVQSATRLARLAGRHPEIRLVTENWLELLPTAAEVHAVLERTEGRVGLCLDFGNWTGPGKYDELASVADYTETCHAKCGFTTAGPDSADFTRCLELLRDTGYTGPLALIYDGPDGDEWAGLAAERRIAQSVVR